MFPAPMPNGQQPSAALLAENLQLRKQLADEKARRAQLVKEKAGELTRSLERNVAKGRDDTSRMAAQLDRALKKSTLLEYELRREKQDNQTQVQNLQKEVDALAKRLDTDKQSMDESALDSVIDEHNKALKENHGLRQQVEELTAKQSSLEEQLLAKEQEGKALEEQALMLSKWADTVHDSFSSKSADQVALQSEMERLSAIVQDQASQLEARNDVLRAWQRVLELAEGHLQLQRGVIHSSEVSAGEAIPPAVQQQLQRRAIASRDTEIEGLRAEVSFMTDRCLDLQRQILQYESAQSRSTSSGIVQQTQLDGRMQLKAFSQHKCIQTSEQMAPYMKQGIQMKVENGKVEQGTQTVHFTMPQEPSHTVTSDQEIQATHPLTDQSVQAFVQPNTIDQSIQATESKTTEDCGVQVVQPLQLSDDHISRESSKNTSSGTAFSCADDRPSSQQLAEKSVSTSHGLGLTVKIKSSSNAPNTQQSDQALHAARSTTKPDTPAVKPASSQHVVSASTSKPDTPAVQSNSSNKPKSLAGLAVVEEGPNQLDAIAESDEETSKIDTPRSDSGKNHCPSPPLSGCDGNGDQSSIQHSPSESPNTKQLGETDDNGSLDKEPAAKFSIPKLNFGSLEMSGPVAKNTEDSAVLGAPRGHISDCDREKESSTTDDTSHAESSSDGLEDGDVLSYGDGDFESLPSPSDPGTLSETKHAELDNRNHVIRQSSDDSDKDDNDDYTPVQTDASETSFDPSAEDGHESGMDSGEEVDLDDEVTAVNFGFVPAMSEGSRDDGGMSPSNFSSDEYSSDGF